MVRFITGRMQEEKIKKQPPETAAYHSKGTRYRAFTIVLGKMPVFSENSFWLIESSSSFINILSLTVIFFHLYGSIVSYI